MSKGCLSRFFKRGKQDADFSIPVLCYHSWTIYDDSYNKNDHIALEHDLRTLAEKGYQVLPLETLVGVLRGDISGREFSGKKLVCLTCDDGRDYDFYDFSSEKLGVVPSFRSILKSSMPWLPQHSAGTRAVSFVIASPDARAVLDHTCGYGKNEWQDSWWLECCTEGVLGIANHSWDHVHDTLEIVRQRGNLKGSFFEIETFGDAQAQIAESQQFIASKTKHKSLPFFGYPYGHVSEYLRDEYFPKYGDSLGITAAFSTGGASVKPHCNVWDIPRFVCGEHWRSPSEFDAMLDSIEAGLR